MEDIYNPLKQYSLVFKDKFRSVAEDTFKELSDASGMDIAANRRTCAEIKRLKRECEKTVRQRKWLIIRCVVQWIVVVVGVLMCFFYDVYKNWVFLFGASSALSLYSVLKTVQPKISELRRMELMLENDKQNLIKQAWEQMDGLNRLYDWDIFTRMMTKTVPSIEFDPFFTRARLLDLIKTYNWDASFNNNRSVIYSHSGTIYGNPFVICRTREMIWGSRTYTGSVDYHYYETVRNSDGKYERVRREDTLYASVSKPYPEYFEKTWLFFGHVESPDLIFNRTKNKFNYSNGSFLYNIKNQKLKHLSQNMKMDFAMSTDEDFEVLFTTTDRNSNQQFEQLFTALAKENMIEVLRDKNVGYGDDFDFTKHKKINTIIADHMQQISFDMNPAQFKNYDYDAAKYEFLRLNTEFFRAIYFCMAPLLCIPAYQNPRPQSEQKQNEINNMESCHWEHEALANFWGQSKFEHPSCVTDSILKTSKESQLDGSIIINVSAYGYRAESHITTFERYGKDRRVHRVPVEYKEYHPVTGSGSYIMREDADNDDMNIDPISRLNFISNKLNIIGSDGIYRRHIASRLKKYRQ